jgi:hypothetical protein
MNKIIYVSAKTIAQLKTPQILRLGLFFTWGACLLTLLATVAAINSQKKAIKTVGEDSEPSIVLAQRLIDGIAGMDAFVVKGLLVPPNQSQQFSQGFEERYDRTIERLVAVAKNITYGEKEEKPIVNLQLGFGKYLAKVQQAKTFHELGNTNAMLTSYRDSLNILDQQLFPAANDLKQVNLKALNDNYSQEKSFAQISLLWIFLSGLTLIGILIGLQLFLSYRMRRTFNPLLLLSTGISLGFLYYALSAFISANNNLAIAKEEAFTSMYALREARYKTYSANAAQGRYLLDTALADKYEHDLQQKIDEIATIPPGTTYEKLVAEIKDNTSDQINIPNFKGFIADEFANITFPGEKAAALKMLSALGQYVAINQEVRLLEHSGKHQNAIALYIGNKSGESNWAFDVYRKANGDTFDINYAAFTQAIQNGYENIGAIKEASDYKSANSKGYENTKNFQVSDDESQAAYPVYQQVLNFASIATIVLTLVAVLTLFGLMPRLKEYS